MLHREAEVNQKIKVFLFQLNLTKKLLIPILGDDSYFKII